MVVRVNGILSLFSVTFVVLTVDQDSRVCQRNRTFPLA